MKYCGKCGAENIDDDLYCTNCGSALSGTIHIPKNEVKEEKVNDDLCEKSTTTSNPKYMWLGRICCIVSCAFSLLMMYFWKFDVTITDNIVGNSVVVEKTLFDLASIDLGSVLGIVVILMVIVSLCGIINPAFIVFNGILTLLGITYAGGVVGVVEHAGVIDFVYKIGGGSDVMAQLIGPTLIYLIVAIILTAVPEYLYRNGRITGAGDEILMFWKEPKWCTIKIEKL